jgi:ribulose-phosphate 3-epimerase
MFMIEVIPAIIPKSLDDLRNHVVRVRGLVNRVQIDVSDGITTPTRTWPYEDARSFKNIQNGEEGLPYWDDVEYEVHLMVKNPESVVKDWIGAGVSSVVFHPSFSEHPESVIEECRDFNVEVGIAFTPSEDWGSLTEQFKDVDFIQVMGNERIGFHGVELNQNVYEIIASLREHFDKPIAIDIGVSEETAPRLVEAGVTKLVAGSAIFGSDDPEAAIQRLLL